MDEGIPGKRQGRREEKRGLRTGQETGSGGRRTAAERPKGQGTELREGPTVPMEPALGTGRIGAEDYGIRTRHEGGRTHGAGQDHRTNSAKLLVAKDE